MEISVGKSREIAAGLGVVFMKRDTLEQARRQRPSVPYLSPMQPITKENH